MSRTKYKVSTLNQVQRKFQISGSKQLLVTCCLLLATCLLMSGCYYDNLGEIHPSVSTQSCDTTGTISYANDIQPILNTSCGTTNTACHASPNQQPTGIYGLDNYTDTYQSVQNSTQVVGGLTFIERITTTDPSRLMPRNATRLPDCTINKIIAWVNRGASNN